MPLCAVDGGAVHVDVGPCLEGVPSDKRGKYSGMRTEEERAGE